ncbi:MAG: CorA family divalent cation transporter [Acutalibacteraceae bacterium]
MVYYKIAEGLKECSALADYTGDSIVIMTGEEIKKRTDIDKLVIPNYKNAHCCKMTVHKNCAAGDISIISKDKKMLRTNFGFIIEKNRIIFIDDGRAVQGLIRKISKNKLHGELTLERFLYEFFETIIEKDLRYIEEMSDRLVKIETAVIRGILSDFNTLMLNFKREILLFYRYYTQLMDIGYELEENENGFFSSDSIRQFEKFTRRTEQLREEIQFLRETSNQLRDVYHSQLDFKTNKIMKLLTIITMFFMPTSTIAAWYGMNFTAMPELNSQYGYIGCIVLNILAILWCWWYMKKKKIM